MKKTTLYTISLNIFSLGSLRRNWTNDRTDISCRWAYHSSYDLWKASIPELEYMTNFKGRSRCLACSWLSDSRALYSDGWEPIKSYAEKTSGETESSLFPSSIFPPRSTIWTPWTGYAFSVKNNTQTLSTGHLVLKCVCFKDVQLSCTTKLGQEIFCAAMIDEHN